MRFDVLIAAYKDLKSREETRNGAWQQEGWDEVVYYTGEQKQTFLNTQFVLSNNILSFLVTFRAC